MAAKYEIRLSRPPKRTLQAQRAEAGLVGEIDSDATGDGVIVCKDGFKVDALTPQALRSLCASLGLAGQITEVDGSSVFCEVVVPGTA